MNFNAYFMVAGQANLIPARTYMDDCGFMNEQVHIFTYDVGSMVEVKEFVVNFQEKEWFGTTSIL